MAVKDVGGQLGHHVYIDTAVNEVAVLSGWAVPEQSFSNNLQSWCLNCGKDSLLPAGNSSWWVFRAKPKEIQFKIVFLHSAVARFTAADRLPFIDNG